MMQPGQKNTKITRIAVFTDDHDPIPENKRRTTQQKLTTLDLMLGQIAN